MLYKILYELRGNVSDLRREMNSLRKQLDEARALNGERGFANVGNLNELAEVGNMNRRQAEVFKPEAEDAEVEEIEENGSNDENNNESLNLSDLGRQMIIRALERNNGNRKKAAEELGISDRTLYRKLKKFNIDQGEEE